VGEGLTYLSESYNCIAHNVSPIRVDIDIDIDSTAINDARLPAAPRVDLHVDVLP
jgi:hypothetical protein